MPPAWPSFTASKTETNSTPPSNIVKNFDPAVERSILRDPSNARARH
jgi:hypothetical protein